MARKGISTLLKLENDPKVGTGKTFEKLFVVGSGFRLSKWRHDFLVYGTKSDGQLATSRRVRPRPFIG